jgi:hypothetical protein
MAHRATTEAAVAAAQALGPQNLAKREEMEKKRRIPSHWLRR